ncbi:VanZ like family protein [Haloferax mucosum ATCC BAA-1512]|uniref:VanZ like family protein n=1 Tax=Haloferax mucosum ATCC BAA-1512 TaxID=662479 RepID=M0IDE0_9EURY|nr:VanZ family protein [Haloferax mucosum]ELZ94776.1 VanZ like family protein [Haloferax mucosum ATCC BAA-1512]
MSRLDTQPTSRRRLAVVAYAVVILVASVSSTPPGSLSPSGVLGLVGLDKWLHALGYAGFAFGLAFAVRGGDRHEIWVAIAGASVYGIGIEVVQAGLPYRAFSVADMGANVLGAVVGGLLWFGVTRAERRWG